VFCGTLTLYVYFLFITLYARIQETEYCFMSVCVSDSICSGKNVKTTDQKLTQFERNVCYGTYGAS